MCAMESYEQLPIAAVRTFLISYKLLSLLLISQSQLKS